MVHLLEISCQVLLDARNVLKSGAPVATGLLTHSLVGRSV
jgi:hypothetical protein